MQWFKPRQDIARLQTVFGLSVFVHNAFSLHALTHSGQHWFCLSPSPVGPAFRQQRHLFFVDVSPAFAHFTVTVTCYKAASCMMIPAPFSARQDRLPSPCIRRGGCMREEKRLPGIGFHLQHPANGRLPRQWGGLRSDGPQPYHHVPEVCAPRPMDTLIPWRAAHNLQLFRPLSEASTPGDPLTMRRRSADVSHAVVGCRTSKADGGSFTSTVPF